MKSLFIMGMPRGGTTITFDLFRFVSGLVLMDENNISDVGRVLHHNLLKELGYG